MRLIAARAALDLRLAESAERLGARRGLLHATDSSLQAGFGRLRSIPLGPLESLELPSAALVQLQEIELPEGTQHGKTFRLRGKGIKGIRSSYPGDLYCHISVETPVKLTEHQRKLLRELDESLKKGGHRHSPSAESWTDRLKNLFS